jgi:hypothetical protein
MQRGLAYRLLGRPEDAIEQLTKGLAATSSDLGGSEFVATYTVHLAEVHLESGNRDVAGRLLDDIRTVAQATGSPRITRDVERLERRLGA